MDGTCSACKWWREYYFGSPADGRCVKVNECGWSFYLVPYGSKEPVLMTAGEFGCNQFEQKEDDDDGQ